MTSGYDSSKADLAEFFMIWADHQGWAVPDFHIAVCDWLQNKDRISVLRMPRGTAKSTLLGIYNAWRYYSNPDFRILHQGDQDNTAYKTARDTRSILTHHPLTRDMSLNMRGEVSFWWLADNKDERNPSMQAAGIMSNITSSRADEAQGDDVEVPRNIGTEDLREKMRYRLGEWTHILVPGGSKLYVGTPHTHDSLYDELEAAGADCLTIKFFEHSQRHEGADLSGINIPKQYKSADVYVFHGNKLLPDIAYSVNDGLIKLHKPLNGLVDVYCKNIWPERFTREEIALRRKECRTVNEWDSQYMLEAKPVHDVRLDPDKILPYNLEPKILEKRSGTIYMLGNAVVSVVKCYWDVSLGRATSDDSVLTLVLQDEGGNYYWHDAVKVEGDLDQQCDSACDFVKQYSAPVLDVESNGVGGFVSAAMRKRLRERGIACGINEVSQTEKKESRIVGAFEPLLQGQMLWAHERILDGLPAKQLRDWVPTKANQADDYIDGAACAILSAPVKIRALQTAPQVSRWRPNGGTTTVKWSHK